MRVQYPKGVYGPKDKKSLTSDTARAEFQDRQLYPSQCCGAGASRAARFSAGTGAKEDPTPTKYCRPNQLAICLHTPSNKNDNFSAHDFVTI